MPYKNIVYAKLEKRLLNDHRWFGMSENAQLNYIKLILIASETYNRIPSKIGLLCTLLRTKQRKTTILKTLKEIELNFPKFKKNGEFYYFEGFEEKTNYIRAIPSSAGGTPKDGIEKEKEKEKEKEGEEIPSEAAEILFRRKWSRNYKNIPELMDTNNLVKEFGMERVENAFHIAAVRDKMSIPYVRGILINPNKEEKKSFNKDPLAGIK